MHTTYSLKPVEFKEFLKDARWKFTNAVELEASPEEIFAIFQDRDKWQKWYSEIKEVQWDEAGPVRVGSLRTDTFSSTFFATLLCGTLLMQKSIIGFESNNYLTMRLDATNRPTFLFCNAFVEHFEVNLLANGNSTLTHSILINPSCFLWIFGFIASLVFDDILVRAGRTLSQNISNKLLMKDLIMCQRKKVEMVDYRIIDDGNEDSYRTCVCISPWDPI